MGPQPSKDSPAVRRRREEQRTRIVIAAITLFARHGIHHTSMQQIADEVGMSVGSLYQYLDNKEAIIIEATLARERVNAEVFAEPRDRAAMAMVLGDAIRQQAEGPIERAGLNSEIVAEGSRNPLVAERLAEQFDVLRGLLGDALRATDPGLSEAEARARAELFMAVQAGIGALRASHAPVDDLAAIGLRVLPLILAPAPGPDSPTPADESEEDPR
ncbi:TetR/AcrR family transcriptional regulator [Microlunatus speluncae]|uniref:TetR/AcrR family transcriptional regulator n=1 Tax=Microlunatus speluncae TaxID=2594267 RepID=UPI001375D549|nr:TetR/AcrR family transcriptional regulator [Microlunatus speluncae]